LNTVKEIEKEQSFLEIAAYHKKQDPEIFNLRGMRTLQEWQSSGER